MEWLLRLSTSISNTPPLNTSQFRYLLDINLTCDCNMQSVVNKSSKHVSAISELEIITMISTFSRCSKTYTKQHTEYCGVIYRCILKSKLLNNFKFQYMEIQFLYFKKKLCQTDELFDTSLEMILFDPKIFELFKFTTSM